MKYIKISIVILLVSFISIFAYKLTTNNSSNKLSLTKEQMKEMLSYTIDGNKTSSMPTKGSGYKVKSITCKSGSILTWDNDNWLLEVEKLESEDLCNIDFTTGTGSYTVTVVPSIAGSLDSTSKTTTENGQVTFYTDLVIDSVSGCTNEISDGKVIVKNVTSNTTCNINVSYMKLYDKLLADNPTRETRNTYNTVFTNNTTGTLFTATEKNVHNTTDTTVYYYAGNTTNNWVKFAGYYWRIIRTNADGSRRMLYSGTSHDTTSGYLSTGTSAFNSSENSPKYVGYMYGENDDTLANARTNTNNSTIKTAIDNWYASNMTSYTKYLSTTAVYCNDRNEQTSETYKPGFPFYYAPRARAYTNYAPTYDCTEASDAFSGSNTNAKLTYPIALMTADEIMRAGGKGGTSLTSPYAWYYLNSANGSITGSTDWWLLSPHYWDSSDTFVFVVYDSSNFGYLNYNSVVTTNGVRPVISLKSDVLYKSGDGSANSPYEILETPDTISDVVKANAVNENGYRYEGSDPNNYIQMEKTDGTTEMWRIVGLFPDGVNGENVIRVRKVKSEIAAYDNGGHTTAYFNNTSNTNNKLLACSDAISNKNYIAAPLPSGTPCSSCKSYWPNATLYNTLKSPYATINYKNTVNYKIYLGTSTTRSKTVSEWYSHERSTTAGGDANGVTEFIGSVGLIYPSDYGYAALATNCTRETNLGSYTTDGCLDNWLYQGNANFQWLISPVFSSSGYSYYITSSGFISGLNVDNHLPEYSPVMALKADVVVTGSGTASDPYVMK